MSFLARVSNHVPRNAPSALTCGTLVILASFAAACGHASDAVGATVSASRPVCDATETPRSRFWVERAAHTTSLRRWGPSPQPYDDAVPEGVTVVHYSSAGRRLLAWLAEPPSPRSGDRPLLVFAHGGFAMSEEDFEATRPFLDAGMIVFMPTVRGENGNPGTFEFAYGELDDFIRSIRFAVELPGVDRNRVYLIGHSAGGMLTSMAALEPDLPVTLTASVGGVYSPDSVLRMGHGAIDRTDRDEGRLRSMLPFANDLAHVHLAYVGEEDDFLRDYFYDVLDAQRSSDGKLDVLNVPGDHGSSLPVAMGDFLRRIQAMPARDRSATTSVGESSVAACTGRTSDASRTPAPDSPDERSREGGLTADQIRRVMHANIGEVQRCYEHGLARDATLVGRVFVNFIIGAEGVVTESTVDDATTLDDVVVASCIADAVLRWRFDRPDPPGPVSVRFPFNLSQSP